MSAPEDPRPRRVAALRYDRSSGGAPKVVAAGAGHIADRILALARENGVPVREDAALAEALARLQLEAEVPAELFAAVAETLVWAYALDARARTHDAGP
jgi:flagellar biosynthesis protein